MFYLEFFAVLLFVYAFIMMILFVFQARLFFSPTFYRNEERFEDLIEFLTPLALPAEDETLLEGILYEPSTPSSKIILYFGGVSQDSVALVEKFAAHYPSMPFITYNYRGYGKSEGKPTQAKLFVDAMHIYDDLVHLFNCIFYMLHYIRVEKNVIMSDIPIFIKTC